MPDWIAQFREDLQAAQGAGGVGSNPQGPRETSPAPAQDDTHHQLEDLLRKASLDSSAARELAQFALSDFSVEEQDALIERLRNPNMQAGAVRRLKERYGKPLPAESSDISDVPF